MFNFVVNLLKSVFSTFFKSRKDWIFTMLLLRKENEILRRTVHLKNMKLRMRKKDRFSLSVIAALSKRVLNHLTIFKPETLLEWQRRFIKNFWSYKHKTPGRKPVSKSCNFIPALTMKQENHLWGCKKISNELIKLNIELHYTTVNRILQTFRKQGLIQPTGSWKKFLKMHWDSLFAMDFMTIDTLFGKRLYLLLILQLKTRKIVRWKMTEHPCREFVQAADY